MGIVAYFMRLRLHVRATIDIQWLSIIRNPTVCLLKFIKHSYVHRRVIYYVFDVYTCVSKHCFQEEGIIWVEMLPLSVC